MAKSGMEMISDLIREVKLLRKEVKVLDQNIKKIANSTKISEIATKALNTPLKDWAKPNSPKLARPQAEAVANPSLVKKENLRFKFEAMDASKTKQESPNRANRAAQTECMCQGKMVAEHAGKSIPLPGLDVTIFDDKDNLIKKTKTNKAGNWMSKLKAGNYVANIEGKFNGKDLYPVNLVFTVRQGMSKLEVK